MGSEWVSWEPAVAKTLYFDKHVYAESLYNASIENAGVFTKALEQAFSENMYTREEVNMRYEDVIRRMEERQREEAQRYRQDFERKMELLRQESREVIQESNRRIDRLGNRTLIVLSSLIVVVNGFFGMMHYFLR